MNKSYKEESEAFDEELKALIIKYELIGLTSVSIIQSLETALSEV